MRTFAIRSVTVLGAALFAFARPAAAQSTPTAPDAPAAAVSAPVPNLRPAMSMTDSLLVLVPMRPSDDIRRDLETQKTRQIMAVADITNAKMMQVRAETEIKLKESQLQTIDASLDLAKKEKDEVQKREWESRKRLAQLEKDLLQRREALRSKEIELAEASRAFADASSKVYDLELALAGKRDQRRDFMTRSLTAEVIAAMARADREAADMERRTLDAEIDAANRKKDLAAKEVDFAKRRKQVLEAQIKLMQGN